jgi:hypothetical protein
MDVLISGKALFAVGTSLDPARLKVLEGELSVSVNARDEVNIPLEVANLRLIPRTAGRFYYREGRRPQLTVLEGQVRVLAENVDRVFAPGSRLTFVEGGAEVEEFAVLPEPELLSPASGTLFRKSSDGALTLDFIWEEVASAETYLFQLSPNILFIDNVFERRSNQARISLADLSEGMYYWRVTALQPGTGAVSPPSAAVPFSVVTMGNTDEEAVSAPDLELTEVTTQSRLISIRGKTEPGARVRIRLESFGRIIMEPKEILVQSTGDFVTLVEAPVSGQFEVFVEAFYRPEFVTTQKTTVDVDF